MTKTFETEDEAKVYAREVLEKGWSVTAGTINPHQPKRIIGTTDIEAWSGQGSERV